MKFIRLRVANYRGIGAADVKFGPAGITLVQGPNEAGKTSLGEAIGILFEYLDSSKARNIEAIKPVHRDEGPEIELHAESGPYTFTYLKRFLKRPETKLTISNPKPENLTGREAHERAEAILRETLDVVLWKALNIQQGDAIHQPELTKQTSLSAALDQAAGGRPTDPGEEGLFNIVRAEYLRYYTERGTERKELTDARIALTRAEEEVSNIEQAIRSLDDDTERVASFQQELAQLKEQGDRLTQEVVAYTASLAEIRDLEGVLSMSRLKLQSAHQSEEAARRDRVSRQALITRVAGVDQEYKKINAENAMSVPVVDQADREVKKAQGAFNEADQKRKLADSNAELRRADFDYYNNKLQLEQLGERKARIDLARTNAAQAEELLRRNKVTAPVLQSIEEAERELLAAKAKLDTGAPQVYLHSLVDGCVVIDGTDNTLTKGEKRSLTVTSSLRVSIPKTLDIEVVAGASFEKLQKKVEDAQVGLDRLCKQAGVAGPREARQAYDDRNTAERIAAGKAQVEKENLRDLAYQKLDEMLLALQQGVPVYLRNRVNEPVICPDLESAEREWKNSESIRRQAVGAWELAHQTLEVASGVWNGLNTKHHQARASLDLSSKQLNQIRADLEQARENISDDDLEKALAQAVQVVASEYVRFQSSETALGAKNPERVKALSETAKGSLQTTQNRRNAAQNELIEVQTRLKIHGEEGLYEKRGAAQAACERLMAETSSFNRRASSAKCLFETIREERDKARRAYVAPLKEKIEQLGRLVFDGSFQVDISEELRITSRTLRNITVPFDSLSGGTREQLSLIFRTACSMIVSQNGGMPLILDDALGYTDPGRLRLMGAVLAKAAKDCQIVIFTCVPERYGNIGEATCVSLR